MNETATDEFVVFIERHRNVRHWSRAELARRAGITQPEISRAMSGVRMPTMRHVRGFAAAFSNAPTGHAEPADYAQWISVLVDLADRSRRNTRAAKETKTP
jgi:transcriptional regulator with XRE-family HTH domain